MKHNANSFSTEADRWDAVMASDRLADDAFLYAVKTTGIYCRPSCASRRPNRQNVMFFQTCDQAESAGFRPCKRCQPRNPSPQQQQADAIARVCQHIDSASEAMTLQALAAIAGLSPYHFHRLFKQVVGMTPKAYTTAQRTQRLRATLQTEMSVTQAIYNAGFETSSSFYEKSTVLLGMKPKEYQQGAKGMVIQFAVQSSALGWVLVAGTAQGICAISLGDSAEELTSQLQAQFPKAQLAPGDAPFEDGVEQVVALVESPQRGLALPLDIQGTAFQHRVWQALQEIPCGETVSYGAIAQKLGQPKAVRAVAQACASNRLAVVIPCHRVVGSDGALKGYRWGRDRKRALLDRESTELR
jgi:AraC family transcriptional regulator, regulatory protein of adaptative response / methylated-DNA-[protein]-cysteine methyltransferase